MKKKIYLCFIAAAFAGTATFAQGPTLTFANTGFVPGDVIQVHRVTAPGLLPGPAGAAQTWTFNTLPAGTPVSKSCLNPASTPYAASFPTATMALPMAGSSYDYYKINSSGYEALGGASPYYPLVYSNTQVIMTYPFSYGNTINDPFSGSFLYGGETYYREGTSQTIADGYGTLALASGVYNVLRVKSSQSLIDSSVADGVIFSYENTVYQWFDGIQKTPLLSIAYLAYDLGGMTYDTIIEIASFVAGFDETLEITNLNIWPNPASDQVNISCNSDSKPQIISLYDMQGRCLKKTLVEQAGGGNYATIDVADVPQGIYFVILQSENAIHKQKLIIE